MQKLLSLGAATLALLALPLAANATVFQFNASLTGTQQVPSNAATGTGLGTLYYNDFNTVSTADDSYSFLFGASGLTGVATGFHIHAPAPAGANSGVVVNLAPFIIVNAGGSAVAYGNAVPTPSASFLTNLQASLAYVNIHTAAFGGGEIRGQLLPVAAVPEPSSYAMLAAGLGLIGFVARRRSANKAG